MGAGAALLEKLPLGFLREPAAQHVELASPHRPSWPCMGLPGLSKLVPAWGQVLQAGLGHEVEICGMGHLESCELQTLVVLQLLLVTLVSGHKPVTGHGQPWTGPLCLQAWQGGGAGLEGHLLVTVLSGFLL